MSSGDDESVELDFGTSDIEGRAAEFVLAAILLPTGIALTLYLVFEYGFWMRGGNLNPGHTPLVGAVLFGAFSIPLLVSWKRGACSWVNPIRTPVFATIGACLLFWALFRFSFVISATITYVALSILMGGLRLKVQVPIAVSASLLLFWLFSDVLGLDLPTVIF